MEFKLYDGQNLPISSPNVQKNDDKVQKVKFVKDTNPVTGSRAARKQKPVTWS